MRFKINRRVAIVSAVALGVVGVGGVAYAATTSNNVIHSCYATTGGGLRIASSCTSKEKALSWNIQGPQGLQGPRGETGARGATGSRGHAGTDGTNGVAGYEMVHKDGSFTADSPDITKVLSDGVNCPVGKKVVGGGGFGTLTANNNGEGSANLAESGPADDSTGWDVGFAKLDGSYYNVGETVDYTIYAICVTPN